MSEEGSTKSSSLTSTFLKVAAFGLSVAFGFYVMGTLDFVMFHEMTEGQAFLDKAKPAAVDFLRGDIPILGFSIADTFTWAAEWFSESAAEMTPEQLQANDKAMDLAEQRMDGWGGG